MLQGYLEESSKLKGIWVCTHAKKGETSHFTFFSRARGRYKGVLAGHLQDTIYLSGPGCPQPLLVQCVCLDGGKGTWQPWWLKKGRELPSENNKKVFFVDGCRWFPAAFILAAVHTTRNQQQ